MSEKSCGQKKLEELSYTKKNVFEASDAATNAKIYDYAEGYKAFIDAAKTEREAVEESIAIAEKAGFSAYE